MSEGQCEVNVSAQGQEIYKLVQPVISVPKSDGAEKVVESGQNRPQAPPARQIGHYKGQLMK